MSMPLTKKLMLGSVTGAAALMVIMAPASAHGRRHHHHFRAWHGPVFIAPSYSSTGCERYYWRWKETGSRYWRSRYFACINY